MTPHTLDELATRLEKVERQNRRLKRFGMVFFALFLLLAGGISYQGLINIWRPGTFTQSISLYNGKPFSFGEMVRLATGESVVMGDDRGFRGNIGVSRKEDHFGRKVDYTGLFFTNDHRHQAGLSVSERGPHLFMKDSTNMAYLASGIHGLLLEIASQDGQQGIALGLNSDQQPTFWVIQDGKKIPLLDRLVSAASSSSSQGQIPVRDVSHE